MPLAPQEMDGELERYNRNNAAQDLTLSDLRLRLSGVQEALARERAAVQASQLVIRFALLIARLATQLTFSGSL